MLGVSACGVRRQVCDDGACAGDVPAAVAPADGQDAAADAPRGGPRCEVVGIGLENTAACPDQAPQRGSSCPQGLLCAYGFGGGQEVFDCRETFWTSRGSSCRYQCEPPPDDALTITDVPCQDRQPLTCPSLRGTSHQDQMGVLLQQAIEDCKIDAFKHRVTVWFQDGCPVAVANVPGASCLVEQWRAAQFPCATDLSCSTYIIVILP